MFNLQVNAVLTLIALSIFADKRVLSTEVSAFIKSARDIDANVESQLPLTEAKLLMWFEINRMRLSDKVKLGPIGFQRWFQTVLNDASDYGDKDFILDAIKRISRADGEIHISEKALSVLVDAHFRRAAVPA